MDVDDANVLCARNPSGVVTTNNVLVALAGPTYVATSAAEMLGKKPLYSTTLPGPSCINSGPSMSTKVIRKVVKRIICARLKARRLVGDNCQGYLPGNG
jgi:hypothetical protein